MVKPLAQKIVPLAVSLVLFFSLPAFAKENFVSYNEAKEVLSKPVPEAGSVSPEELRKEQEEGKNILLLDARVKSQYDTEKIPGAKLPRPEEYYKNQALYQQKVIPQAPNAKLALEEGMKGIPRDAAIVTYCHAHCGLSKNLKLDLEGLGFTDVRWLVDGIDAWREKGYPTEKR